MKQKISQSDNALQPLASTKRKHYLLYTVFVLLAFAAGLVLAWSLQQWRGSDAHPPMNNASVSGVEAYGGDFVLEAPWGESGLVDYRGQLVLAYFGFASCPDICPTALGVMKSAVNLLDEDTQQQVNGLFISIDPERDTAQEAEQYAQYFHKRFHGLSGTPETVSQVAQQYGALYRKMATPDSALAYTMDHSSVIYLIDRQGTLRAKIQHGVTPAEVAEKIRQHL